MTGSRRYVALGFDSVHDTLIAEDTLKSAGVPAVTIPSPRELGELCGIALRVLPEQEREAVCALERAGAPLRARADITDL